MPPLVQNRLGRRARGAHPATAATALAAGVPGAAGPAVRETTLPRRRGGTRERPSRSRTWCCPARARRPCANAVKVAGQLTARSMGASTDVGVLPPSTAASVAPVPP